MGWDSGARRERLEFVGVLCRRAYLRSTGASTGMRNFPFHLNDFESEVFMSKANDAPSPS